MDDFDAAMDAAPPPIPSFGDDDALDLGGYVDESVRSAAKARGDQFATVRGLNIDEELAEYSDRQGTLRQTGGTVRPGNSDLAKSRRTPAGQDFDHSAPWGEETLRYSSTQASKAVKATDATMRMTAASAAQQKKGPAATSDMSLPPIYEEFDLEHPPDEEKTALKLPIPDPKAKALALTVYTLEDTHESVEASDTWTVQQLITLVGSRFTIWQVSFFSLSETTPNSSAPDRWLDPRNTLAQEGLKSGSSLVFKIKFFKYPKKLRDPVAVRFFYAQVRSQVMQGALETSDALAFRLAGLQLAIQQQTFRPQDLRKGYIAREIGKWVPKQHLDVIESLGLSASYVERRIFASYEKNKFLSQTDAIYAYLKQVKDLQLYGCAIFNVTLNGEPRVVGVAEDGIMLSTVAQQKLQHFTPRGNIIQQPKYEFTGYEDITKIALEGGTVTVVILSDTDSACHKFQTTPPNALAMVELICGYRRMLEAYVDLSRAFDYPLRPIVPHPALYAKPAKRKKMTTQNSRAEVFKAQYIKSCRANNKPLLERLIRELDLAIDTDQPFDVLSFSGLKWGRADMSFVLETLVTAKTYQFVEDEDFIENMKLKLIDFSGNNVLEKGFFGDLEKHFDALAKFPFEVRGVSFHNCRLDEKAMAALRPAIGKLKMLERADFSKNPLKDEGIHEVVLGVRDANASFLELNLSGCNLKSEKVMRLIAAMLDKNSRLQKLVLSDCSIVDMGVLYLLKGLVNHTGIRSLDMTNNKLGSSKASSDLFIWATRTPTLEEFRMGHTDMPVKSTQAVVSLLEQPASQIKCLDIGGNDYGAKGSTLILQALAKNSTLQELYLADFDISEKNIEFLLKFFKKAEANLRVLSLRGTPIGKKGLSVILETLETTGGSKLKVLDLGRLHLAGKSSTLPLVDFLRKATGLEKLIMSGCTFDKDAWTSFCKSIQQSKSLERLELDAISPAKVSITELRDTLRQVPNVRDISMRACDMGPEQLLELLSTLNTGTNSGLRSVDVRNNKDLVDVLQNKKWGQKVQQMLEPVYLDLRFDFTVKPAKK